MKRSIKEKIAEATRIPDEILLDSFRVVVTGEREVTVENFKGILEYTDKLIRLRVTGKRMTVEGAGLEIRTVTDDEIRISGRITAIGFQ